jgi:selenium-binding protein 1
MLKGFRAVPPLVTDINLSLDDRFLYVSCWGSGEFRQYDVSDPFHPRLNSTIRLGGIVTRAAHPSKPGIPLNGGPQMVELSFDGRRAYVTNSLYTPLDEQFYPDGIKGWMARIETDGPLNQMRIDSRFLPEFDSIAATPNSSSGWRRLL